MKKMSVFEYHKNRSVFYFFYLDNTKKHLVLILHSFEDLNES